MSGDLLPDRSSPRLSELLREREAVIVRLWRRRARELSPARDLSRRALVDHLPRIIRRIADALESGRDATMTRADAAAEEHALDRLGRGFELEQVIAEYRMLRRCILELWEREAGSFDPSELNSLWDVIEELIATSAAGYSRASERMLRALDRISEAALEPGDLGSFLEKLLDVALEAMEVADTLAILLRDGDRLRVRAAAGHAKRLAPRLSTAIGEGFAGSVAALMQPRIVSEAEADALADSRLLREQGVRVLFGLPLAGAQQLLGVAYIGSGTAAEFSEHDKLLFRTMIRRAALAVQNARLAAANSAIVDAALDCVISMNAEGAIVGWNRAAEQTFGWSRAEALGAPMVEMIVPPSLRAAHSAGVDRYLKTGTGRFMDRHVEISAVRRDGTEFPVELTITQARGEQPPLFTGFIRDLSEHKAAEQERLRLVEELRRAVRSREDVLAIVSHDLRNPLESISLSASLLAMRLQRTGAGDMDKKQVEVIQRASGRMAHLLGDLVDMASIQAGRLSIEARPVDLVPLLDEAYAAHESLAVEANIALCRDLPAEGGQVLCDPARVQQVLSNLLGNAIKFCRSGDRVTLRARRQDGDFLIAVADTGPGMAQQDLDAAFQRYWSAPQEGRKGTGLGLFVAKGIVEAHGGRIWASSPNGQGATFSFTLPAA